MRVESFCFYHMCAGVEGAEGCDVATWSDDTDNCELEPAIIERP